MASFNLALINPQLNPKLTPHRVVPIRFARAVDGFSDDAAPDPDDHGFTLPAQFCTAHGPVVGLMGPATGQTAGPLVRIKIIRDRLSNAAKLFPAVDDASVAKIDFPVNAALDPNNTPATATTVAREGDCVFLKAATTAESETQLKIHFGTAGGPVMAECAVRVYPRLVINVQAHLVTINGVAPTTSFATIQRLFKDVSKVYAQAGVFFDLAAAAMNEAVAGFARAGTVTLTNIADQENTELQTVLRQNPVAGSLNAYVFGHYFDTTNGQADQVLGIAFSTDDAAGHPAHGTFPGCQAGITLRDSADPIEAAHTAAHEIGHALRLIHYANVNNPGRPDIWAHRCLMHPIVGVSTAAPSSVARADVGYGTLANGVASTGQLLMTKPRAGVQQSDEINVLRAAQIANTFAPI